MADQYPPDPAYLRETGIDAIDYAAGSILWRIGPTASSHVTPWNRLRTWGPLRQARWDPHPRPAGDKAPLGVAYLGEDVLTCLAEVFQERRMVDVDTAAPYVTAFAAARDLKLADLTGTWLTRAGGSSAVALHERKERTRAWARAIHQAWPELDGIIAPSAIVGGRRVVVVWSDRVFPVSPELSEPLNSPAIVKEISSAAARIGYDSNIDL